MAGSVEQVVCSSFKHSFALSAHNGEFVLVHLPICFISKTAEHIAVIFYVGGLL
jgi:hypothetical protein